MIVLMTATAALVFVCCLLRLAFRRQRGTESAYAGSHRRQRNQRPCPNLRHPIATAGRHGLGMIRKSPGE
jgi:hypothetical protein